MSTEKTKLFNFRVSDEFARRLQQAARVVDQPASQIVREAVREKLEQLAQKHPELREQAAAA